MGYCLRLAARVILYAPSQDSTYIAFVIPVVKHWLERVIAQWVHRKRHRIYLGHIGNAIEYSEIIGNVMDFSEAIIIFNNNNNNN